MALLNKQRVITIHSPLAINNLHWSPLKMAQWCTEMNDIQGPFRASVLRGRGKRPHSNNMCHIILWPSARHRRKLLYFVWSPPWHLYILLLANLLAFYLTYFLAFYLAFYLAYLLALYLAYLLAYYLLKSSNILSGISPGTLSGISFGILSGISSRILFYLTFYLAYLLAFYLAFEVQRCALSSEGQVEVQQCALSSAGPRLRSSGAHWAGKVPGWGPAVGRSQVEVQRWEGPRLRSSGAHSPGKVPGWGPAVRTELGRSQVEVQQCALSSEVGEELGEELARRKWRWKLMQTWSRRNWRRRRRRRRTTALIKSNNPHLAGGEKKVDIYINNRWMDG